MNIDTKIYLQNLSNLLELEGAFFKSDMEFWVIRDWVGQPSTEELAKITYIYMPSVNNAYDLSEIYDVVTNKMTEHQKERKNHVLNQLQSEIDTLNYRGVRDWCREHLDSDARITYQDREWSILQNTLFITKEDAENYLKNNAYRKQQTPHAHAHKMKTATSPNLTHLWKIIGDIYYKGEIQMNNDDKIFLQNLKDELNTQETDFQAGPRFWVIRDGSGRPSPQEISESTLIFIPSEDDAFTIDRIPQLVQDINDNDDVDVFTESDIQNIKQKTSASSPDYVWIKNWCQKHIDPDARIVYQSFEWEIVPNTLFLTKKGAQDYIVSNAHNLTQHAHTYAMTAHRSPKVARLMKILEETDWNTL